MKKAVFLLCILALGVFALFHRVGNGILKKNNSFSSEDWSKAGEIVHAEGHALVNGKTASPGMDIRDGESVVTDAASLLDIKFGEYRILRLMPQSHLTMDSSRELITLESGSLAVVQYAAPSGEAAADSARGGFWSLETPLMTAYVNESLFWTSIESSRTVYFCLCHGSARLEDSGGYMDLWSFHHRAIRVLDTIDGIVYSRAPVLYHEDENMELLAGKVNRSVNWTKIPDQ